jgi:hypothetical protein
MTAGRFPERCRLGTVPIVGLFGVLAEAPDGEAGALMGTLGTGLGIEKTGPLLYPTNVNVEDLT